MVSHKCHFTAPTYSSLLQSWPLCSDKNKPRTTEKETRKYINSASTLHPMVNNSTCTQEPVHYSTDVYTNGVWRGHNVCYHLHLPLRQYAFWLNLFWFTRFVTNLHAYLDFQNQWFVTPSHSYVHTGTNVCVLIILSLYRFLMIVFIPLCCISAWESGKYTEVRIFKSLW